MLRFNRWKWTFTASAVVLAIVVGTSRLATAQQLPFSDVVSHGNPLVPSWDGGPLLVNRQGPGALHLRGDGLLQDGPCLNGAPQNRSLDSSILNVPMQSLRLSMGAPPELEPPAPVRAILPQAKALAEAPLDWGAQAQRALADLADALLLSFMLFVACVLVRWVGLHWCSPWALGAALLETATLFGRLASTGCRLPRRVFGLAAAAGSGLAVWVHQAWHGSWIVRRRLAGALLHRVVVYAAVAAAMLAGTPLQAATFYWDPDTSAVGDNSSTGAGLGGNGTWNTGTSNWWDGSSTSLTVWPNSLGDTAVFIGFGGVVQLGTHRL